MNAIVAVGAKSDQIFLCIFTAMTTEPFVMNFKLGHRTACLASPAITPEHFVAKLLV
jgi:hypothetical protein